nr:hypothetical protein [Planctomycetota bacterium]
MTSLASWLILIAGLAVLALKGGSGFFARPLFETAVAIALAVVAVGMGRRFRRPSLAWVALA